jgi:hypothetical protein
MAREFSYYLKTGRIVSKLRHPFLRSERAQTSQLFRAVLWLAVTWLARYGDHQGRALHVILVATLWNSAAHEVARTLFIYL